MVRVRGGLDGGDRRRVRVGDRRARYAVRDHDGIVARAPHRELHVAAHRRDRRGLLERGPIDPVEAEGVVRVPQHHDLVAQAAAVQAVRDQAHGPRRVPLLAEHHDALAVFDGWDHNVVDHARGQTGVPIAELALLAVIHAAAVLRGDPLAPPAVVQLAPLEDLLSGEVGIADKVEVRVIAETREGTRQALHAHTETARLAVKVGTFEAEQDEDSPVGREDHALEPSIFSAWAWSSAVGAHSSVVRRSSEAGRGPTGRPVMSVATPPTSASKSRLAAVSKTRTGIGAQKMSKPPEAVSAIEIAIEPSM